MFTLEFIVSFIGGFILGGITICGILLYNIYKDKGDK